jgi:hypothetical protein
MNPSYFRLVICDHLEAVERIVAAAETDLQPHYLERLPPSVAEAERGWFDQQVGGLSRSPESIAAALRFEQPKSDPYQWSAAQINNGVQMALYSIDPNGCQCAIVKRYHDRDDAQFADPILYESRRQGDAVIICSRRDQHRTCELYQCLVRHFGFLSEQFSLVPDFFYAEASAATDPQIAAEHAWVLRGRGEGDGFPQYFNVMTRFLPQQWFDRIYWGGDLMSYRDEVQMHQIMSWGLPADELEVLRQAELDSAVYRVENDPACQPLHRSILEKAVREGLLKHFDDEQRARSAAARSADSFDGAEDYFAALAQKLEKHVRQGRSTPGA